MSDDITSEVTILQSIPLTSYEVAWSGTALDGSFSVEGSNSYKVSADGFTVLEQGNWTPLVFSYNGSAVDSVPVTDDTGSGIFNIANNGLYAIRLVYTSVSGTGTLDVIINGKVM